MFLLPRDNCISFLSLSFLPHILSGAQVTTVGTHMAKLKEVKPDVKTSGVWNYPYFQVSHSRYSLIYTTEPPLPGTRQAGLGINPLQLNSYFYLLGCLLMLTSKCLCGMSEFIRYLLHVLSLTNFLYNCPACG